jgi:hypothetical protein
MAERKSVHPLGMVPLMALLFLMPGCATEYRDFPRPTVMSGAGGEKTSLCGVDLWNAGLPPQKFEVIGLITDNRPCGMLAMSLRQYQVATLAKRHGGNALILKFDQPGMRWRAPGNTPAGNSGTDLMTAPIYQEVSKYFVIRYL